MLGEWEIISKITDKRVNVRCKLCKTEAQIYTRKLNVLHKCPSIIGDTKYCYKCQTRKNLDFFHADKTVFGGYSKLCKECYAERVNVRDYKYNPVNRRRGKPRNNNINGKRSTKLGGIELFLENRQKSLKYRHKNKTFAPYNLPNGYLWEQYKAQEGRCYYSGVLLDYTTPFSSKSISVDRLYPEKGYTIGNIVLCVHSINAMKLEMNVEEFKEFLKSSLVGFNKFLSTPDGNI